MKLVISTIPFSRLWAFSVFLIITYSLFSSGCAFKELDKEIQEYEKSFGLAGEIVTTGQEDVATVVMLYTIEEARATVTQYLIVDETKSYSFIVTEGKYRVVAYKDLDNDLVLDEGEPFGIANAGNNIVFDATQMMASGEKSITGMDTSFASEGSFPHGFPRTIPSGIVAGKVLKKLGVVTSLDNELFALENGSFGYWKPLSFLKEIGFGIYFTEPYDPDKIPVLFVHGALGTPLGWEAIVEQLDPSRYQPWYFYYPSGFRLDAISEGLNNYVKELHDKHRFEKMHVIAHSMGGLVSRDFLLKNLNRDKEQYIEKFISMSTPWGGVGTAALGLKHAPTAVPSWHDVAPDSEFIEKIYNESFPETLRFYLLFGVSGKCSMMMANNDGTVEIASEIDYRAQEEASGFFGYDEDHMSILTSERAVTRIGELIDGSDL